MRVLKFGGTSVGNADRIRSIGEIVSKYNEKLVVVTSAVGGVTNKLVAVFQADIEDSLEKIESLKDQFLTLDEALGTNMENFILDQIEKLKVDKLRSQEMEVLAFGERTTAPILNKYFEKKGLRSTYLLATNFMVKDIKEDVSTLFIQEAFKEVFNNYDIVVMEGFICVDQNGSLSNLGRGGSDLSASLVGAALQANEVEIWTDISGMQNNDPRIVDSTFTLREMSFDEAAELAYFGAKVLHPQTIIPARDENIPVTIKNTFSPDDPGTRITANRSSTGVKALAGKDGITVIKVKSHRMLMAHGFLAKIFEVFDRFQTSIDMITTSEVAVSLTIDNTKNLPQIIEELETFGQIDFEGNQSIIALVGDEVIESPQILSVITNTLRESKIRMLSFGGSRNNISLLVPSPEKEKVLNQLNSALFFKKTEAIA